MIETFRDIGTADVFDGRDTKAARRTLPRRLWRKARRKLDQLDSAVTLADLRSPPGNRLEALEGDRAGHHSVRINRQYRICFRWSGVDAFDVEIVDYH